MPDDPAKPDDPDADTWVLTLRGSEGGSEGEPPLAVRVRKLLKVAARLGLRCVRVASIDPDADRPAGRKREAAVTPG